jgi:hypothetical protein
MFCPHEQSSISRDIGRRSLNFWPLGYLTKKIKINIRCFYLVFIYLLLYTRVGSKLVYHRLPWKEPDAPHTIQVLYEDDDIVSFTLYNYVCLTNSFLQLFLHDQLC